MKTSRIGEGSHEEETNLETVKMSIDASAVDHLMTNLTNLYSEPFTAVLREYSSNAFDSHIRAGVKRPIEITTPTYESPVLVVRDFGVGMSKDEIANVYSRYGLSTKTSNNSEIGGFGLGCKSALAIADKFDIVAVKDGVKTTAFIKKNARGVGVVHFVSEAPTSDDNGVEIRIPITSHIERLKESNLSEFFIGMPEGSVLVNGNPAISSENDNWQPIYAAGVRIGAFYQPAVDASATSPKIIASVGGVTYSLNAFASALNDVFKHLRNYYIVIDVPIGSVDLTPSRESIMQTEKSLNTISALLHDFRDGIAIFVADKVDAAANYREAAEIAYKEVARGFWSEDFTYRGTLITPYLDVTNVISVYRDSKDKRKSASHNVITSIIVADGFNLQVATRSRHWNESKGIVDRIFIKGELSKIDELCKNIYYYFMSTFNTGEVRAFLFEDESALSPVFQEMAKNAISLDDVIATANEWRSAARKASLAATKAAKATGTVKLKVASLPVWDVDDTSNKVKPMASNLVASKPLVYIHAHHSSSKLTRIMPSIGYQYENGGVPLYDNTQQTVKLMQEALKGYHVAFLNSQRKLDRFLEAFPTAQSADVVLGKYLSENYYDYDLLLAQSIFNPSTYHYSSYAHLIISMSNLIKKYDLFDSLESQNVKSIMEEAERYNAIYEKSNSRLIAAWVKIDAAIVDTANKITNTQKEFLDSLVLVRSDLRNLADKEYVEHLIRYINMLHPA